MLKIVTVSFFLSLLASCGPDQIIALLVEGPDARVPNIAIATPSSANEAADSSYTVQATFESIQVDDTWNLYYISEATPQKSATIATNLPVTNRTIAWDTSEMPAGQYFFYGELNASDAVVTTTSAGSIYVDHPGTDNSSPTVTMTSQNSRESYSQGDTITVSWSSSDTDGDTLTADIDYSTDNGNTWSELTTDETGSSYSWVTSSDTASSLSYRLRVTVSDDTGATASDATSYTFSIL